MIEGLPSPERDKVDMDLPVTPVPEKPEVDTLPSEYVVDERTFFCDMGEMDMRI